MKIEHNMPERDYHAIPSTDRASQSFLKSMRKSPMHAIMRETSDTAAMQLGRAVHSAVLTPQLMAADYVAYPGKTRRGKQYDAFLADHAGVDILTQSQLATAHCIADAVTAHPAAHALLTGGRAEVSIFGQVEGVRCKMRADYITDCGEYMQIVDLKTTRDADPQAFARDSWNYGYHWQAGLYCAMAEAAYGKPARFSIVAVESDAPHDVVVYEIPEQLSAHGFVLVQSMLEEYRECLESGDWPGISQDPMTLGVPAWAVSEVFGS